MVVSEEVRTRLSRWCATRIPAEERRRRQIGYTIQGDEITILDRRPPTYPELDAGWTSTPLARLRRDAGDDGWSLHRPVGGGRRWRADATGTDPIALLDQVTERG